MNQASGQTTRRRDFNFPHRLPAVASVTLMIGVALIAIATMSQLKNASDLRRHTFQTILTAQSFQDDLLDIQRGARSYAASGDTNALEQYQNAVAQEPQMFAQLVELTTNNPQQQDNLKKLSTVMTNVLAFAARAVTRTNRAAYGISAVSGRALDALKIFSDEEQRLLDVRDAAEQSSARQASRILVVASVLAAGLLIYANWKAGHQLNIRHRVEAKLNETLALQTAIFNSANYAIVTTDKEGIVQTFNPAAERLLGYSAKEVIGKATPMLWRDQQEIAERAVKLSARFGQPVRPTFETTVAKIEMDKIDQGEWTFIRKDGSRFPSSLVITGLSDTNGDLTGYLGFFRDISDRKQYEAEREKLVVELRQALAQVKTLSGLIPICGWCKKIRDDSGYWQSVEQYVHSHSKATFTHGICPTCQEKFKEEIERAGVGEPDTARPQT
ncbi:MAG TPA: PAS domain S-box protein [Verrucomicrobiae bacterium]|nr:PAS domain S-box protein [Verrucomicrobiae bacterium]